MRRYAAWSPPSKGGRELSMARPTSRRTDRGQRSAKARFCASAGDPIWRSATNLGGRLSPSAAGVAQEFQRAQRRFVPDRGAVTGKHVPLRAAGTVTARDAEIDQ